MSIARPAPVQFSSAGYRFTHTLTVILGPTACHEKSWHSSLSRAAKAPLKWTNDDISDFGPVIAEMCNCPYTSCVQASTKGPVGLKGLYEQYLGVNGLEPTAGDVITLLQDVLTVGPLQHLVDEGHGVVDAVR